MAKFNKALFKKGRTYRGRSTVAKRANLIRLGRIGGQRAVYNRRMRAGKANVPVNNKPLFLRKVKIKGRFTLWMGLLLGISTLFSILSNPGEQSNITGVVLSSIMLTISFLRCNPKEARKRRNINQAIKFFYLGNLKLCRNYIKDILRVDNNEPHAISMRILMGFDDKKFITLGELEKELCKLDYDYKLAVNVILNKVIKK
jgi:hypothetical protein